MYIFILYIYIYIYRAHFAIVIQSQTCSQFVPNCPSNFRLVFLQNCSDKSVMSFQNSYMSKRKKSYQG